MTTYELINVKNIYEQIAHEFDVTRTYKWSWINDYIDNLPTDSLICDIGCGNGRNMKSLKHKFIGVDNCTEFINICRSQNLNVIESDMLNINLDSNSVDHIICIAAFHHLSNKKNRLQALYEMKRLLKNNNSTILLSVWSMVQPKKTRVTFEKYGDNMVSWKNKFERYYYIFRLNEIKDLFIEAGLQLIEQNYDCGNEIFLLKKY